MYLYYSQFSQLSYLEPRVGEPGTTLPRCVDHSCFGLKSSFRRSYRIGFMGERVSLLQRRSTRLSRTFRSLQHERRHVCFWPHLNFHSVPPAPHRRFRPDNRNTISSSFPIWRRTHTGALQQPTVATQRLLLGIG